MKKYGVFCRTLHISSKKKKFETRINILIRRSKQASRCCVYDCFITYYNLSYLWDLYDQKYNFLDLDEI